MSIAAIIDDIREGQSPKLFVFHSKLTDIELDEALNKLNSIPVDHKNYACALFLLGYCLCKKGQLTQAILYLDQAIALNNIFAMVFRAILHEQGLGGPNNYDAAIRLYDQAIALENSDAMVYRAILHEKGLDGPENYDEAISLYDQAIALKNSTAMFNRALLHEQGLGGPQNYAAAISLYDQTIALGNSTAMNNRAVLHESGLGGPENYDAAIRLYDQAIALGNSGAMFNRAVLHESGLGGPENYDEAISLYDQAIALENSAAMFNRALLHEQGLGGPQNYAAAISLYDQAIALENSDAIVNRAVLHEKGLGGPPNYDRASHLYFQAFCLSKSEHSFGYLQNMADRNIPIALYYLMLAYLELGQEQEAEQFYLAQTQSLAPLLLEKTLALIDTLPEQQRLVEQYLAWLQLNEIPSAYLPLWNHVQFRLEAKTAGYQTAYLLTNKYPDLPPQLSAAECYELGNVALNDGADDPNPENKIQCLTQACHFFYEAYQKGDKQIYGLLQKLLGDKEALERGQKPRYALEKTSSIAEEARLSRFTAGGINKPLYSQEIQRIADYLETHQEKLNSSEHHLLTWVCRRLSYNIPLSESLSQPHIKQQISDSPVLANNVILKSSLTDEVCEKLLQASPNRGQGIYEALANHNLTASNLKILAKGKEDVVKYLKQGVAKDTGVVINEILSNEGTTSVYKSYFYVQRGFFKPKLGCGTLKQLQDLQRQIGETQGRQAKNRHCLFSFFNLAKDCLTFYLGIQSNRRKDFS